MKCFFRKTSTSLVLLVLIATISRSVCTFQEICGSCPSRFYRRFHRQFCKDCKPQKDINNDWKEDLNDLIYVFRALDDPLKKIKPNATFADVNKDGKVDVQDAIAIISYFYSKLGSAGMGNLTVTYFDDYSSLNWDQPNITGNATRRFLQDTQDTVPSFMRSGSFKNDRSLQTCGAETSPPLKKGKGPKPKITWDTGNCKYDPTLKLSALEKAKAYGNWIKYGTLLQGAYLLLPDGAKAYANYRSATGNNIEDVRYQNAINEDSVIREGYDQEIKDVKNAVRLLFSGSNFDFHSTTSRLIPNGDSDNWRKALGGHHIWSEGSVVYNKANCQLEVTITVKVEDFYNFNPGQSDVSSGLPDDDNCLFSILGWAKPFYSHGSITTTEIVDLTCCEDTDCGDPTEFDCTCNECVTQCPTQQLSGGQGYQTFSVDLKKTNGTFELFYDMYTIPDACDVFYEGSRVFTTGGLVSGSRTVSVPYGSSKSKSTIVILNINAPQDGTAWEVAVRCPP